jgi:type II secretory pathway pseudopilin PulG
LIEVLVVIAIIALLLGILIPAVMSGRAAAEIGATRQFMNSLRTALIAYQRDHDAFPPSGADNLRDWLLAPGAGDGHAGPGFKKQRGGSFYGPTYGPYMEIASAEDLDDQKRFVDYWTNVIHYAMAKPGEFTDNQLWGGGNARFDLPGQRPEKVDVSSLRAAKFVLHSSGPDGQSGNEQQREDDIIVTGP